MTTPITNRIHSAQSAAIVLLFVVGIIFAPLALSPRVEHSHPPALNGRQLAHIHSQGGPKFDDGRSHHHHDHAHHHHDHPYHHHAKTESTEVDDQTRSSRLTTQSEISASSRHQHFNLFGLCFTIHFDGRSSDATGIEEYRPVDFGLLVARVLDVRSPMPPADVTVDSCLTWQSLLSYDSLDDGCEADRPETPPPQSVFC